MGLRDFPFAGNAEQSKKYNHGAASSCKPERPGHSVVVSHETRSKNCSSPEPGLKFSGQLVEIKGCFSGIKPTDTTAEVVKPVLTCRLAVMNLNSVLENRTKGGNFECKHFRFLVVFSDSRLQDLCDENHPYHECISANCILVIILGCKGEVQHNRTKCEQKPNGNNNDISNSLR